MVTRLDIARHQVRELCRGNLIALYKAVVHKGDMKVNLYRRWAVTHMIQTMAKAGFTERQIAAALNLRAGDVRNRKKSRIPKTFHGTIELFGSPLAALKASEEIGMIVNVRREYVEYLMIEDMAAAGWSVSQIVFATGFGRRRVQRIVKKIKEEEE